MFPQVVHFPSQKVHGEILVSLGFSHCLFPHYEDQGEAGQDRRLTLRIATHRQRGPFNLFPKVLVSPGEVLTTGGGRGDSVVLITFHLLKGNKVYFLRDHCLWRITIHFHAFINALLLFGSHEIFCEVSAWTHPWYPQTLSYIFLVTNFSYLYSLKKQQLYQDLLTEGLKASGFTLLLEQSPCTHRKYKIILLI